MNSDKPNIQDAFLNAVRKGNVPVSIFTTNGYKIAGAKVRSFDNYAVLLEKDGNSMLVYKHAVSSIAPEAPLDMGKGDMQ